MKAAKHLSLINAERERAVMPRGRENRGPTRMHTIARPRCVSGDEYWRVPGGQVVVDGAEAADIISHGTFTV